MSVTHRPVNSQLFVPVESGTQALLLNERSLSTVKLFSLCPSANSNGKCTVPMTGVIHKQTKMIGRPNQRGFKTPHITNKVMRKISRAQAWSLKYDN